MLEPMSVRVEVWPVAADSVGLWLVSDGDAWRSGPVPADSEPHAEVEYVLSQHGGSDKVDLLHSTSWRVDGPAVYLTYMAVVHCSGLVREEWPNALPIGMELFDAVGKPPEHSPVEAPAPRYIDVLLHGIRHLRFLLDNDTANAAAFSDAWRDQLTRIQPAIATMYDRHHGQPSGSEDAASE
ncbi:hypothetical protein ACIBF1_42015 [Spirillospora sp. NPDC050679]